MPSCGYRSGPRSTIRRASCTSATSIASCGSTSAWVPPTSTRTTPSIVFDPTADPLLPRCRRRQDLRRLDVVELRELRHQVRVAFRPDLALVGASAARRALAVAGVELVDHAHPLDDAPEGREAHAVEAG